MASFATPFRHTFTILLSLGMNEHQYSDMGQSLRAGIEL